MFSNLLNCRVLLAVGLIGMLPRVVPGADRLTEVQRLVDEYDAAEKVFFDASVPEKPTIAESIRRYEDFPAWLYLPQFLKLAESDPRDDAAFRCCLWILDRTYNVGNSDKLIFNTEQSVWDILAKHHTQRTELPTLCLRAADYDGRAQERFLRGIRSREDVAQENRGFATIALADLLARKLDLIEFREHRPSSRSEFGEYCEQRQAAGWGKDLVSANIPRMKAEANQLFREVLATYAEVPLTISAKGFRNFDNLGQKATQSLHALEFLTNGSEPPSITGKDLQGQPLEMRDYRGKVVVISFWFTGCGPCISLIPTEQRLINAYKDRPFALLGVCGDENVNVAQKTAAMHGISWPCWFDGEKGPIVRDWNVHRWPTTYILDQSGKIAAKNLVGEDLENKVKSLMDDAQ
jgi:thiol-disulfide isomerase/thioredoxin